MCVWKWRIYVVVLGALLAITGCGEGGAKGGETSKRASPVEAPLSGPSPGGIHPLALAAPIETVTWELASSGGAPQPRQSSAFAYDSARRKMVLFGGAGSSGNLNDTWEWDGRMWKNVTPATSPPARTFHALAYDSAREKVVLFGGSGATRLDDTWEWDGASWTQRTPATSPPARGYHSLSFDPVREKVVLFGGWGPGGSSDLLSDVWEWDGETWAEITPSAPRPVARHSHSLAFDGSIGKVVLFGGFVTSGYLNDLWTWDGAAWTKLAPSGTSPSVRFSAGLTFDPKTQRLVLFGGNRGNDVLGDLWEWDSATATWTAITMPEGSSPAARGKHVLAFDEARGKVVLFGGYSAGYLGDTWERDGWDWRRRANPPARYGQALAYDSVRQEILLFGGSNAGGRLDDLWAWGDQGWVAKVGFLVKPEARNNHAMAFDEARARLVLVGGRGASAEGFDNVWEWDGEGWTEIVPPPPLPPAREKHALAYDRGRGKTVLFGGFDAGANYLADTWEWDGAVWTKMIPSGSIPAARLGHALSYDDARGKVVLFGGSTGTAALNDMWEWDGASWNELSFATSPAGRQMHGMAFDGVRGKLVLFGGLGFSTSIDDTWEWDGADWAQVALAPKPSRRESAVMAFDSGRRRMVLFGGYGTTYLDDTWELYALGGGCGSDDECHTGFCVDGVCCDSTCGGGEPSDCMACSVAAGAMTDGFCGPTTGNSCGDTGEGLVCNVGECVSVDLCEGVTCPAPGACQEAPTCDPNLGCVYPQKEAGTLCRAGVCEAGKATSAGFCDGVSAACPAPVVEECGYFLCATGACLASCSIASDCTDGAFCDEGQCEAKQAEGGVCKESDGCLDGLVCKDGHCGPPVEEICKLSAEGTLCGEAKECSLSICLKGACVETHKLNGSLCEGGVCIAGSCKLDREWETEGPASGEAGGGEGIPVGGGGEVSKETGSPEAGSEKSSSGCHAAPLGSAGGGHGAWLGAGLAWACWRRKRAPA